MAVIFLGQAAAADPVAQVEAAAQAAFDRMPSVRRVDQIAGRCGADDSVNAVVAYCTTTNQILLARGAVASPQTPYMLAHVYGHAVQVQHGVADIALGQSPTGGWFRLPTRHHGKYNRGLLQYSTSAYPRWGS
jgi:hypothetical protein